MLVNYVTLTQTRVTWEEKDNLRNHLHQIALWGAVGTPSVNNLSDSGHFGHVLMYYMYRQKVCGRWGVVFSAGLGSQFPAHAEDCILL